MSSLQEPLRSNSQPAFGVPGGKSDFNLYLQVLCLQILWKTIPFQKRIPCTVFVLSTYVSFRIYDHIELDYRLLSAAMWVMGIELRSSERTVIVLNHWAIFPAPSCVVFFCFVLTVSQCIAQSSLKLVAILYSLYCLNSEIVLVCYQVCSYLVCNNNNCMPSFTNKIQTPWARLSAQVSETYVSLRKPPNQKRGLDRKGMMFSSLVWYIVYYVDRR